MFCLPETLGSKKCDLRHKNVNLSCISYRRPSSDPTEEDLELSSFRPQFESTLLSVSEEGTSDGSLDTQQTTLVMEVHEASQAEGRTLNVVVANPMASMSGDLSCSFVTVDLDSHREESLSVGGASEEEGGVSTGRRPSLRQRCLASCKQGARNFVSDLKLFFW